MDWERINIWTNTLYTLIHSLELSLSVNFDNVDDLDKHCSSAATWINPICSYSSTLTNSPSGGKRIVFRRNPNDHFLEISQQVVKMLIQDLVVIFDQMMEESMSKHGFVANGYPQNRVEKLSTILDKERYDWSRKGCLELIAARNVLVHGKGVWNDRSIKIIDSFIHPAPKIGDVLTIGTPMLFYYRKAIRTFLNETMA